MKIQTQQNERGFLLGEFEDSHGHICSIQESSSGNEHSIWLGIDDAEPKIRASDLVEGGVGWVPYTIPEKVLLTTRMHLNQDQVRQLLPLLQHFAETGKLPETSD